MKSGKVASVPFLVFWLLPYVLKLTSLYFKYKKSCDFFFSVLYLKIHIFNIKYNYLPGPTTSKMLLFISSLL